MKVDKTLAVILLGTLVGMSIPLIVFFWKKPKVKLTPAEKELISFNFQPVTVRQPSSLAGDRNLESPVKPSAPVARQLPGAPGTSPHDPRSLSLKGGQNAVRLPELSMVYQDGPTRTAIVDGRVVKEGMELERYRVIRIENNRVLLKIDGKELWLKLD